MKRKTVFVGILPEDLPLHGPQVLADDDRQTIRIILFRDRSEVGKAYALLKDLSLLSCNPDSSTHVSCK